MSEPSTAWRESVAPDEEERFQRYAEQFVAFQERKSKRYGNGRALHRKQILALKAQLDVLPGLPEHAKHGLFRQAGSHDGWVRLSNGSMSVRADATPDVRGFGIKVFGVNGPGALGSGPTQQQDFALINIRAFSSAKSAEFAGLTAALANGTGAALRHLFRTYPPLRALRMARHGTAILKTPFSGFATEHFYSAAPISCGAHAVRVRLLKASDQPTPGALRDWSQDVRERLTHGPLTHDMQLQFFTDEATTPVEDASRDWPETVAPYLTVARLIVPQQEFDTDEARAFAGQVENAIFDPWNALMEHRPLGDVMRARKVVYFASERTRGVA